MVRIKHGSHIVLATKDVTTISKFFSTFFGITAHYENDMFSDFVLPTGFRVAFFKPVGKTTEYFSENTSREHISIGITTEHIDELYQLAITEGFQKQGVKVSGPPKEHPWGEKSFLLIDPDGNRWEITESPSHSGFLVNR